MFHISGWQEMEVCRVFTVWCICSVFAALKNYTETVCPEESWPRPAADASSSRGGGGRRTRQCSATAFRDFLPWTRAGPGHGALQAAEVKGGGLGGSPRRGAAGFPGTPVGREERRAAPPPGGRGQYIAFVGDQMPTYLGTGHSCLTWGNLSFLFKAASRLQLLL